MIDFGTAATTYHYRHPDDYSASPDELDAWTRYLAKIYGPYVEQEMTDARLPAHDLSTRSRIVLLAELSNGAHPQQRLRNACRYYGSLPQPPIV